MEEDVLKNFIEVSLEVKNDFLKVAETLERMGVISYKDKTVYQSCHILHKKGKYYIVHFKELFLLDGKSTTITTEDIIRRNTIATFLAQWKLCKILNPDVLSAGTDPTKVKVISHRDKGSWKVVKKYNLGKKEKNS